MESFLKLFDHLAHGRRHRAIWIEAQVLLIFVKSALRVAFAKKDVTENCMRTGLLPATQLPISLGELVVTGRSIGLQFKPPKERRFRPKILLGLIEHGTQPE